MVYATLVADAAKVSKFRDDVKMQVRLATGLSSGCVVFSACLRKLTLY